MRGLFGGLGPTLFQLMPNAGLMFISYEALRHALRPLERHDVMWEGASGFICGAGAGMIAKIGVYPLDTVRRRLQAMGLERPAYLGPVGVYRGAVDCWNRIVEEAGWRGLYRGLPASLWKSGLSTAVAFGVRDAVLEALEEIESIG